MSKNQKQVIADFNLDAIDGGACANVGGDTSRRGEEGDCLLHVVYLISDDHPDV